MAGHVRAAGADFFDQGVSQLGAVISLVPVVLGDGVRLLDGLLPLKLEVMRIIDAPGVTHLSYRVMT